MPIKSVDAKTLKIWMDEGNALVLDVRESAENSAESIKGSKLLPLGEICKAKLPEYSGKKLVIHCHKGGRGGSACEKLLAEDENMEIYNLEGGILAWKEAGFEVNSSGIFFLPLDRQVQLTIGICLIIFSLLGYFISQNFFLLTGFLGIGLSFAGLTGFCGLAMIMAKMPWNKSSTAKTCCMTH